VIRLTILAIPNEYEVIITYKCNWKCNYCSVDTHSHLKLSFDDVMHKIQTIPQGSYVTLSGGEVGSMKRSHIEQIIHTLQDKQCVLGINTNGLFLQRYVDLAHNFRDITYHCTENIDISDEVYVNYSLPIDYMIVVNDDNFFKLKQFLDKYPDIRFSLVAASNPEGMSGPTLSTKLKYRMLTEFHLRMTEDSKKRIFTEKQFNLITYL
jgi:organic radical activating enzyme